MSITDWLDERTGYRALASEALNEPVPGGARWAYVWGSALSISFVTQAVTGVLLMTSYQPSATTAWSSVAYINDVMAWGWVIRGIHHFGAQAMIILLGLHLAQTLLFGAYKRPREVNWLLGLGLAGVTLGFALTGYLLPWDQKGYWATKVATNIAGSMPVVGQHLQRLMVGGAEYGHLTLTRFYTLHVAILPVALVALLAAHVAVFRRHGVTTPPGADLKKRDNFYPKQVFKDLVIALLVLGVLYGLTVANHGAPLDAPADPASDYPARPEWYFLSLFEALKHVPGHLEWIVAALVPAALGGYLVALPFLDRKPGASLRQRAGLLTPLAVVGLVAGGLTYVSLASDSADPEFVAARAQAAKRAERSRELALAGVPPAGPLAMLAADPQTRGPELFSQHCASCHRLGKLGPKEGEDTAPDLAGFGTAAWVLAVLDNPDSPRLFGKTPFKGKMPSFTRPPKDPEEAAAFTPLKRADQLAIAEFLAAEARGEKGTQKAGEALVEEFCTSCHRLDGETDDDDSLAPELRGWASKAWIAAQIASPDSGVSYPKGAAAESLEGHMPAFAEQLSKDEIALLASWLQQAAAQ